MNTFGMFVKQPCAGKVKTRLAAGWDDERAARLYESFVLDLAERFRTGVDQRTLCFAPDVDEAAAYFREIARDDYVLWPQPNDSLGRRMHQFFVERLLEPDDRVVIIGSDSPTLPAAYVDDAFDRLRNCDCVIGPATDGGYYLIGQRFLGKDLFEEIEWSSRKVLLQTVERVGSLGMTLSLLPPWYDVDTADDVKMMQGHIAAMETVGGDSHSIPKRTAMQLAVDTPNRETRL